MGNWISLILGTAPMRNIRAGDGAVKARKTAAPIHIHVAGPGDRLGWARP